MASSNKFNSFIEHFQKIKTVQQVEQLLGWDERTMMPAGSSTLRGDQTAYIKAHLHDLMTDSSYVGLLEDLASASEKLTPDETAAVNWQVRQVRRQKKIPSSLIESMAKAQAKSYSLWQTARKENSFKSFLPVLKEVFELARSHGDCLKEAGQTTYEGLLSEYEPKVSLSLYEKLFADLKQDLVPLVKNIKNPKSSLPTSLSQTAQEELNRWAIEKIGFDFNHGRLDVTVHPFCTGMGSDIRLTTRYNEDHWSQSFYGCMHEAGHGLYEFGSYQLAPNLPVKEASGLGMHESQSRFWENQIGRSREFCEFLTKNAPESARSALGHDPAELFSGVNQVKPSYIRVEADEVTYNLHILLRFEIEVGLFSGKYNLDDLPEIWWQKMSEYFGLPKTTDDMGVLQDVHWPVGSFGYFPTYALGNMIAAQLEEKMSTEIPFAESIRSGNFATILSWLQQNVHKVGSAQPTLEIVKNATGAELSHQALTRYLKRKFT